MGAPRHPGTQQGTHTHGHQPPASCSAQWVPVSKPQLAPQWLRPHLTGCSVGHPQFLLTAEGTGSSFREKNSPRNRPGEIIECWVLPQMTLGFSGGWWDPGAGANPSSPTAVCWENRFISREINSLAAQLKPIPSCKVRSGCDLATSTWGVGSLRAEGTTNLQRGETCPLPDASPLKGLGLFW